MGPRPPVSFPVLYSGFPPGWYWLRGHWAGSSCSQDPGGIVADNKLMPVLLIGGGAYLLYQFFFASSTPAAASATVPPASPQPAVTPPAPATAPAGSLVKTYAAMVAAAQTSGDPNIQVSGGVVSAIPPQKPWDTWNYYLGQVSGITGLPYDTQAGYQGDPKTPLTAVQYWAVMAPWLSSNKGFAGLGAFRGLAGLRVAR